MFTLDPSFEPTAIIRQRAMEILQRNLMQSIAPANLIGGVVELKEFAEKLPGRVNKILDTIGNNEFKINVNAIDEKIVLEGLQKVANRISLGLILAALIVGASMLMRVETTFKILGYPGFAMIFFPARRHRRHRPRLHHRLDRRQSAQEAGCLGKCQQIT